jgi:hypothetical protein
MQQTQCAGSVTIPVLTLILRSVQKNYGTRTESGPIPVRIHQILKNGRHMTVYVKIRNIPGVRDTGILYIDRFFYGESSVDTKKVR